VNWVNESVVYIPVGISDPLSTPTAVLPLIFRSETEGSLVLASSTHTKEAPLPGHGVE
jgi:hypothetical protein